MEQWRPIGQTNGLIEVSDKGRVRSNLRRKGYVLKTQPDKKGYHRVRVTIEREKYSFKVHREVAKLFLPNPGGLPQVNHKDGNKGNNAAENLEWCTNAENARHAVKSGLWAAQFAAVEVENGKRKKPVIAYKDLEQMRFESVSDAERYFDSRHISDVLKGKRDHVKGWSFVYERGDA